MSAFLDCCFLLIFTEVVKFSFLRVVHLKMTILVRTRTLLKITKAKQMMKTQISATGQ